MKVQVTQTVLLASFAIVAFAANSVISRIALSHDYIDPLSFAAIRILSGAVLLFIYLRARGQVPQISPAHWYAPFSLMIYVVSFTLAYTQLGTSTGAVILFSAVHLSMVGWGLFRGERITPMVAAGMLLATAGLAYFLVPGWSAPSIEGAILMVFAGVAWSVYSISGRGVRDPLAVTAANFVACMPIAFILFLTSFYQSKLTVAGVILAIASGAYASAVGYVLWFRVLKQLSMLQASTAQFLVPVIASLGGIVLLGESLSWDMLLAGLLIFSGIALVNRRRSAKSLDSNAH